MSSPSALCGGFPVVIEWPVAWGEMDAFNHVNNSVYFRYFESARMAYFERIGYPAFLKRTGLGPILAATSCTFRRALSYPDALAVGARVSELGEDRFTMQYRLASRRLQAVAAEGQGVIVSYDYRHERKVPLPEDIRGHIEALEGQAFPRLV